MFNTLNWIFACFAGILKALCLGVVKVPIPRQAVLTISSVIPQPGRSVGSAGAHSQTGSANPQPRQAVLVPPARKKWVCLVPAAMIIPAPLVYIKVVVAHFWHVGDSSSGQQGNPAQGCLLVTLPQGSMESGTQLLQ